MFLLLFLVHWFLSLFCLFLPASIPMLFGSCHVSWIRWFVLVQFMAVFVHSPTPSSSFGSLKAKETKHGSIATYIMQKLLKIAQRDHRTITDLTKITSNQTLPICSLLCCVCQRHRPWRRAPQGRLPRQAGWNGTALAFGKKMFGIWCNLCLNDLI